MTTKKCNIAGSDKSSDTSSAKVFLKQNQQEILNRIKKALNITSDKALADKFGLNPASINAAKKSGIPATWIIDVHCESGVPITQLIPGIKCKQSLPQSPQPESKDVEPVINTDLLSNVISGVDEALAEAHITLQHDKKAELISLLYEHFKPKGESEKGTIKRFLRLVA